MFDSFTYPFKAIKFLIMNKTLWKYIAIPVFLNIVVVGGLGTWSFFLLKGWLFGLFAGWWMILAYILITIVGIALFAFTAVTFMFLANIINAPFNDLLSEKTEEILSNRKIDEKFSLKVLAKDLKRTVIEEIKKLFVFGGGQLLLLLLNLIPVIGSIAYVILSFIFTVFLLSYEYVDYPMSRKRIEFKNKLALIKKNWQKVFGFGLAVFVLLFIPLVNLVFIPLCVVGGTRLYSEVYPER
jgi:CysZ protein